MDKSQYQEEQGYWNARVLQKLEKNEARLNPRGRALLEALREWKAKLT